MEGGYVGSGRRRGRTCGRDSECLLSGRVKVQCKVHATSRRNGQFLPLNDPSRHFSHSVMQDEPLCLQASLHVMARPHSLNDIDERAYPTPTEHERVILVRGGRNPYAVSTYIEVKYTLSPPGFLPDSAAPDWRACISIPVARGSRPAQEYSPSTPSLRTCLPEDTMITRLTNTACPPPPAHSDEAVMARRFRWSTKTSMPPYLTK